MWGSSATTWRCSSLTAGKCVRERSEERKKDGEFFKAHAIQALAIETARAPRSGCTAASASGVTQNRP